MPPDREAILARRALLVASALAGIATPSRAEEPESCPTRSPLSAEDKEAAKALYQEGMLALERDDPARAAELWRRAYERARLPKLLLFLADAARRAGDLAGAHAHLKELLRCADSPATLRLAQIELEKLEESSAELTFEGGVPGASIEIDGKPAGTLPLSAPLWLAPGRHEIVLLGGPCERDERRSVDLAAGTTLVIRFAPDCEPRVCLQPCLSPPPPPPPNASPRVGFGAGTLGLVGTRPPPGIGVGARIEAFYAAPLGETFALHLGVAALPAGSGDGALVPVGADLAFVVAPGALRLGLGATSGWMFATAKRSEDETWRPRSSFFLHPHVQPIGLRVSDHVEAGIHVGLLLGTWANAKGEAFRAGFVTTSLCVRIYFGEREREWEDMARR